MAIGSTLILPRPITILKSLGDPSSNIAGAETIVFQHLIPANTLRIYDRLRLALTLSKSGTTDTANLRVRMGTAGTVADALQTSAGALAATSRAGGWQIDYKLASLTGVTQLGSSNAGQSIGYGAIGSPAFAAPVTIPDASTNALYFSVGIYSSSTNDTVRLEDALLQLIPYAP